MNEQDMLTMIIFSVTVKFRTFYHDILPVGNIQIQYSSKK